MEIGKVKDRNRSIDYKSVDDLKRYLKERGTIVVVPGKKKGVFQRSLRIAVLRARYMALLPYANVRNLKHSYSLLKKDFS